MTDGELKGKAKQVKGKVGAGVGELTDNRAEQVKGKIEQIEGIAQEEIGRIKRKAKKL